MMLWCSYFKIYTSTVGTIFICYRFLFILLMICVLSVVLFVLSWRFFHKKKTNFLHELNLFAKIPFHLKERLKSLIRSLSLKKTKFTFWVTVSIYVRAVFFFLFITPKWLKKTKSVNISDRHKIYTIRLRMWRQSNIKWFVQIRVIQLWICRKRPTFIVENTKSIIVYIIIERHSIIDCGCHIVNIHSFRA